MTERAVTLKELLDSRERRVRRQKELLAGHGGILLSITLNIPGPVKDRETYRRAMEEGVCRLCARLPEGVILYQELRFPVTGPEGYMCLNAETLDPLQAKAIAVETEEADGLGWLLDIDVITENGGVSRSDLGRPGRRCLLCGEDAKICARSQRHPMEQLLAEIERMLEEELQRP